VTVAV